MKKFILFLGVLLLSLVTVACGKEEASEVEVKGITIVSANDVRKIVAGETLQLTATVYPAEANQDVVWSSKNEAVATVDANGLVTGVDAGSVGIVATSSANSSVTQEFLLVVEEAPTVVVYPESIRVESVTDELTCKAGETLSLVAYVLPREASQNVSWSSSDETIATVSKGDVTALKAGTVTITATSRVLETVCGTITLTIEAADKPVVDADWATMAYTSHSLYETGEDNSKLKIKGVVTHVTPVKENKVSYFIQNGNEGYYVYQQDAILYPVEVGKVYEVGGYKKYYKGLNEVVNVEHCVELSEQVSFNYVDISNSYSSNYKEMYAYQGAYVTAKGLIVSCSVNTSKAFNVVVNVNNVETTVRIDPSYMSATEFEAICTLLSSAVAGLELEYKGFFTAFGYGTPSNQIQVVKASDLTLQQASAQDLLKACADQLVVTNLVGFMTTSISLPTSVSGFDATITWESNSNLIDVTTGTVTHSSNDEVVTLTAVLKLGETEYRKEFTVNVAAKDDKVYETIVSLDLDDALDANKYGCSETKPGYDAAVVALGTPGYTWLLQTALIANSSSDLYEGKMSIRAKAGDSAEATARIEVQQAGEYNVVEFKAGVYGNHVLGTQIRIEYTLDNGTTWLVSETIITLNSHELETFRVKLPEGSKRVAIVVVENSGKTVNIDSIKLMK